MSEFKEVPASKKNLARRKLLYGVGINDADYCVWSESNRKNGMVKCPFYSTWAGMLRRCYCKKYKLLSKTYDSCSVYHDWLTFSKFKSWMIRQDWKGKALDKDLLVYGNKEYHPDKCMFVDQRVNKLLTGRNAKRGQYVIGVSFNKIKMKFVANCNDGSGKLKYLGCFKTEYEASIAYRAFKKSVILGVANESEEILKQALTRIAITYDEACYD